MIDKIITNIVDQEAPDQTVAVLMSGGTDSLTVAAAAHRLNKKLNCYTFRVDGKDSDDSIYAEKACKHFGWNFKLIDVPVNNIENDFFTLIKKYECKKKTHVECTFPFLYVYPHIKEKYILLFPFCSVDLPHKKWPYYNDLILLIKKNNPEFELVIAPSPNEIEESKKINAQVILKDNKALTITQLAGLIDKARFIISNDTGPAHMAAHLGAKGVTLFGYHTTCLLYTSPSPRDRG